jgi:hypothetical protein
MVLEEDSGSRRQERSRSSHLATKQGFRPGQRQALSARRPVRGSHEVRHQGRWLRHTAGDPRRRLR